MGFTKLDSGIIQSSIMAEPPEVFKVWIALLASCQSNGIAPVSPVFIASVCHMDINVVMGAITVLSSPDKYSRTITDEGRRIKQIDGGYEIINYLKYREFTYSDSPEAIRQRKHRGVTKRDMSQDGVTSLSSGISINSNVDIPPFNTFWTAYPKKVGKGDALKAWKKIKAPAETLKLILAALEWQRKSEQWIKEGGQYIPNPSTYLNQARWLDEPMKVINSQPAAYKGGA